MIKRLMVIGLALVVLLGVAQIVTAQSQLPQADNPLLIWSDGGRAMRTQFRRGLAQGHHPNVFAKFGGSTTETTEFIAYFGVSGYDLAEHTDLQATVDYFSGGVVTINKPPNRLALTNPFQRRSYCGRNGLILTQCTTILPIGVYPYSADCAGKTNLDCEIDAIKPSFALVWFGINEPLEQPSMTAERFKIEYAKLLKRLMIRNVIPVIGTIGRNCYNQFGHDGHCYDQLVAEYNVVIRELAVMYKIPLIDFATAMEPLPNFGLHPDMLHLSSPQPVSLTANLNDEYMIYGNNTRNLLTLQMLQRLREAMGIGGS